MLNTKIPYKIQVKYFESVQVTNGYIAFVPSAFDGFSKIHYLSAGDNVVPGGTIMSGYYHNDSKNISYITVTTSTGQAYDGMVSFTAFAVGE